MRSINQDSSELIAIHISFFPNSICFCRFYEFYSGNKKLETITAISLPESGVYIFLEEYKTLFSEEKWYYFSLFFDQISHKSLYFFSCFVVYSLHILAKFPFQNIREYLRIPLPFRELHTRSDEKSEEIYLSCFVFRDLWSGFCEDLIHDRLEGSCVIRLSESECFYPLICLSSLEDELLDDDFRIGRW